MMAEIPQNLTDAMAIYTGMGVDRGTSSCRWDIHSGYRSDDCDPLYCGVGGCPLSYDRPRRVVDDGK